MASPLCSQGFNEEDGQNLSYLSNKKDLGQNLGLALAVGSFIALKKRYFSAIKQKRQYKNLVAMIGLPPLLYISCQYYTHYQRIGPNNFVGNFLMNNIFNVNSM